MTVFYLGTHMPAWLGIPSNVPLFVSHRRLVRQKSWPVARTVWALDSGGFSELSLFGEWRTTAREYIAAVRRYDDEIGQLCWAAPQDWMCESRMVAKTGLTVLEHQRRTVDNFLNLRDLWGGIEPADLLRVAPEHCPFVPVLQGRSLDDYQRCADLYERRGIHLPDYPLVGLGSVCRRQASDEIGRIASRFAEQGIALHGFGVKSAGLARYAESLDSADSMAWSYRGRRIDGCSHGRPTVSEANCRDFALAWHQRVITAINTKARYAA